MHGWDDQADEATQQATSALSLSLKPTRLSIGPTRVLLNWRLDLTNNGTQHIIALRMWSDMVSAHSSVPSSKQLGGPDPHEARLHKFAQLAPGEEASVMGEWQMPREAVRPVDNSPDQLILPLARLRFVGAGLPPQRHAFVIGNPPAPGEERLRTLQLSGDLQIHSRLAARAVS